MLDIFAPPREDYKKSRWQLWSLKLVLVQRRIVANANETLADVVALHHADKGGRRSVDAFDDILFVDHIAGFHQCRHARQEVVEYVHIVAHTETGNCSVLAENIRKIP